MTQLIITLGIGIGLKIAAPRSGSTHQLQLGGVTSRSDRQQTNGRTESDSEDRESAMHIMAYR